ncbi:MAG: beta-lactamase family protein [Saprospiraceae bacterium]|nr:beta-lactamase family protein [Saprospiraceae bacterium]
MKKIIGLIIMSFLIGGLTYGQENIITDYLDAMEKKGFSGSVLVAKAGRVIHSEGYGYADRKSKTKITPQSVFTTGSITKPFTGAAILKLEIQGKIRTDDLMSKYINNVPDDKKDITIHHLLTHSSGFPGAIGSDDELIGKEDFIKRALSTPLRFDPGSQYRYSNVGYSFLAIIIEKQSGMTYEEYLQRHLFKLAGMNSTGYVLSPATKLLETTGYDREGNEWGKLSEKNWGAEGPGWHLKGNGGILSTVEDMYRYDQALKGDVILSDAAKKKHYSRHIEEGDGAGTYYGYGWAIFPTPRNTDLVTHNGGNGIFFADFLRYLEEDITIIFMTNRAQRKWEMIPWEIARILLKPGYTPDPSDEAEDMSEAEEAIIESLVMKFLEVIGQSNKEEWKAFITEHTTKDFQDMGDMDFHLNMFDKMHESLKDAQPLEAEMEDGELNLLMSNNRELTLGIEANDQGRYLVSGISVN